jgi:hypothetical protein
MNDEKFAPKDSLEMTTNYKSDVFQVKEGNFDMVWVFWGKCESPHFMMSLVVAVSCNCKFVIVLAAVMFSFPRIILFSERHPTLEIPFYT